MEIVKLAGFALVAVVLITLLRQYAPAYAVLALTGCALVFLSVFALRVQPVLGWMRTLSGSVDPEGFACLLKAAGIALLAQTAQDLCRDAGMSSLGTAVELGGRCLMLAAALPLFQKIMERFVMMLQ